MRNVDPAPLIARRTLRFRARTLHRWIDGAITTGARRLGDALNLDEIVGPLMADEFIAEGGDGRNEHAPPSRALGALNTNVVLYLVPIEDGPPSMRDPTVWVKKHPERVKVGMGPFEIEGAVFMGEGVRLNGMIAT